MPSAELLAALTDAVQSALRELASIECAPRAAVPAMDVSAALPVSTAGGAGCLTLALPNATARELARRVLAAVAVEPDAACVLDCAGEVVNVIAGQAKTRLFGTPYHFTLGTPQVTTGAPDSRDALVLAFDSDAGPFALLAQLPH